METLYLHVRLDTIHLHMKKCTYCGKEYPDAATVCAIDNEPLTGGSLFPLPDLESRMHRPSEGGQSIKRPKGVWVVTIWMFLFAGLVPFAAGLLIYFGPPEIAPMMPLWNLAISLSFAVAVSITSISAWLGHRWARFALIALALSYYGLITRNLYNLGQSGVVPESKMVLVWGRMARALITMSVVVLYLSFSRKAQDFFNYYRRQLLTCSNWSPRRSS